MSIDWTHFTPWSSLAGGLLIGFAISLLLLLSGRIAGISRIVGGLLRPGKGDVAWRWRLLWNSLLRPCFFPRECFCPKYESMQARQH